MITFYSIVARSFVHQNKVSSASHRPKCQSLKVQNIIIPTVYDDGRGSDEVDRTY